jgi:hypothetical protein
MQPTRIRLAALTTVLLASIGMASAAIAGGGPSTSEPFATIDVTHDSAADQVTECVGTDGRYQQIRSHNTGTMTSIDPRLTGTVTTDERIMINRSTLTGAVVGDMQVRDPVTRKLKFDGEIYAVFKAIPVKGVIVGKLADGQRLIANFSAIHEPNSSGVHRLIVTVGGPAVGTDLAVVQSVSCPEARRRLGG